MQSEIFNFDRLIKPVRQEPLKTVSLEELNKNLGDPDTRLAWVTFLQFVGDAPLPKTIKLVKNVNDPIY